DEQDLPLRPGRQPAPPPLQPLPPQAFHGIFHRLGPFYRLRERAVIGRAASRRRSLRRSTLPAVMLPSSHLLAQILDLLPQCLESLASLASQVLRFLVQLLQPLVKPGTSGLVQLQRMQQFLPPLGFEVTDPFLQVLAAAFRRRHAIKLFHRRWRWRGATLTPWLLGHG